MADPTRSVRAFRLARLTIWSAPLVIFGYLLWANLGPTLKLAVSPVNRTYRIIETVFARAYTRIVDPAVLELSMRLPGYRRFVRAGGQESGASVSQPDVVESVSPSHFPVPLRVLPSLAKLRIVYANDRPFRRIQPVILDRRGVTPVGSAAYVHERFAELDRSWSVERNGELVLWQRPPGSASNRDVQEQSARLAFAAPAALARGLKVNADAEGAKAGRFESVDEFLSHLPSSDRVATANFSLEPYLRLPGYRPASGWLQLPAAIRGSHVISTYVENEDLDFQFVFQDINRHPRSDPVRVTVSSWAGTFFDETVTDDGVKIASGEVRPPRRLRVHLPRPPTGVYHIAIETPDDVFTRRIETRQHKLVFEDHVYVTDNLEYVSLLGRGPFPAAELVTDATVISAYTAHPAGLQKLAVGDGVLKLRRTHEFFHSSEQIGLTRIQTPRNDVYLAGGSFAFSEEQYFGPELALAASIDTLPSLDGYDYVIGRVPRVAWHAGHVILELPFRLSASVQSTDAYLSLIATEGNGSDPIVLQRAELQAENVPLPVQRPALLMAGLSAPPASPR